MPSLEHALSLVQPTVGDSEQQHALARVTDHVLATHRQLALTRARGPRQRGGVVRHDAPRAQAPRPSAV